MRCIALLDTADRVSAKAEIATITSKLMPGGKPAFTEVVKYPMISALIEEHSRPVMLKVVFMLIRDLCNSVNVVRNMSEDQMIDAAAMLLDECGNFRLEDYVLMFTLAKRGQLPINDGKGLMDRLDLEVMGKFMDAFWEMRNAAGNRVQDEMYRDPDGTRLRPPALGDVGPDAAAKMLGDLARELRKKDGDADSELLKQQERQRQRQVVKFTDAMIAGKCMTSPEDIQFYQNNQQMIELLLKIKNGENEQWK